MALTEPTFVWSASAFLLGAIVMLDLNTFGTAIALYRLKKSGYYLALVGVTVAHMLDLIMENIGYQKNAEVGVTMPISQTVLECLSLLFAWAGACGFITLNFLRFRGICGRALHSAVFHAIQGGVGLFIALYTANTAAYFVLLIQEGNGDAPISTDITDTLNLASTLCDAVINGTISILFLKHLSTLVGDAQSADVGFREGLGSLLNKARIALWFEAVLILSTNMVVAAAPDWDPCWSSVYLAESVRLRIFCVFLETLARIMRRHANPGKPSLSQSESTVASAMPKSPRISKATGEMAAPLKMKLAPSASTSALPSGTAAAGHLRTEGSGHLLLLGPTAAVTVTRSASLAAHSRGEFK
ncbi:hypothetical protein GGF32_006682 [Allomyces javanicus]|nr:hypothetical protein GGF32_006682 [Allomyces javanicus]